MRTLLALILSWLMPAQGKRRAPAEGVTTADTPQAVPTQHTPADSPTQWLIITRSAVGVVRPQARLRRSCSPRPPAYLRGEDVPLIRPYLIAYERAHGIYHQEAAA